MSRRRQSRRAGPAAAPRGSGARSTGCLDRFDSNSQALITGQKLAAAWAEPARSARERRDLCSAVSIHSERLGPATMRWPPLNRRSGSNCCICCRAWRAGTLGLVAPR